MLFITQVFENKMEVLKITIFIFNLIIRFFDTKCKNINDHNKVPSIKSFSEGTAVANSTLEFSISTILKQENAFVSKERNTLTITTEATAFSETSDEQSSITSTEENKNNIDIEKNMDVNALENYVFETTLNYEMTTKSNEHVHIALGDSESLLLQNRTQNFLSTFVSEYQREVITMQLKFCPYTSLCTFSFGLYPEYFESACCKDCSCDFPACMNNKTCCPDIIFNHINMFNSTEVNAQLHRYLVGQELQKDCILLSLSNKIADDRISAFGYSTCPLNTDAELFEYCIREYNANDISAFTDTIPVISNETHELYRNKYCALCNGVLDNQIETLHPKMFCVENTHIAADEDILNAVFDGNCHVKFLSEYNLDYCDTGLSKCNITGSFEESVCVMYRSVVYVDEVAFQNIFCSLCNGIIPQKFTCLSDDIFQDSESFPFSGLLGNNKMKSQDNSGKSGQDCSENQLFDSVSDSCSDLVCSDITILRHGECIDVFEKMEKVTYTAFLRLKPVNPVSIIDAYNVADVVIDHMRDFLKAGYLCGMQMLYRSNMTFQENELFAVQNSNLLYFETRMQFHVTRLHDPYKVAEKILTLHDSEYTFRSKIANLSLTFKFEVRDNAPRKFDIISFLSTSDELHDWSYHDSINIEALNLTFLLQKYLSIGHDNSVIFPHLRFSDDIGYCYIEKQYLNILWLTRCPRVKISFSDFPWVETEDGVAILHGDFVIKSLEYYFLDENHVMLCEDQYRHYMTHIEQLNVKSTFKAESIVSIVCSVLSILALCFTFFIFCYFTQLRQTIPGKNNMSLVFTLLCAQILYLIGSFSGLNKTSIECIIFGILIHFSWLLALFWMNICTFHMYSVLTRTKVISYSSGTKRLVIYHVYAQTMAAIFVSINIAISHIVYGNIGYGENACYISSQRMIMYTFVIPTGVIILSNFIMFIFVIVQIKRSPEVQKSVKNERNDIIIFAKLSTITGATWVFGFLYIWTNLTVMSYLFILMNASQGVFIMFAFVINKRVMGLFKVQVLGMTITNSESVNPTSKGFIKTP